MIACEASVSVRVRRESWDKSKKKMPLFCSCSNFPTIARLVTLATQAKIMSGWVMDDCEYVSFVLIRKVDQDRRLSVKGSEVSNHVFSF